MSLRNNNKTRIREERRYKIIMNCIVCIKYKMSCNGTQEEQDNCLAAIKKAEKESQIEDWLSSCHITKVGDK